MGSPCPARCIPPGQCDMLHLHMSALDIILKVGPAHPGLEWFFLAHCWHADITIDAWEHWFIYDADEGRKRRRHESDDSIVIDLDYDDDLFSDGE